jgi:hypothetical protein
MFGSSFSPGDHVIARDDIPGLLGATRVKRGARGIVRGAPGLFGSRYEVEFHRGGLVRVSAGRLRRAAVGQGERDWVRYRDLRGGITLGMLVLGLVPAVSIIRSLLAGQSPAGLIAALPGALVGTALAIGERAIGVIGLPLLVAAVVALWLVRRRGR